MNLYERAINIFNEKIEPDITRLSDPTADDEGKVAKIINGKWAAGEVSGGDFYIPVIKSMDFDQGTVEIDDSVLDLYNLALEGKIPYLLYNNIEDPETGVKNGMMFSIEMIGVEGYPGIVASYKTFDSSGYQEWIIYAYHNEGADIWACEYSNVSYERRRKDFWLTYNNGWVIEDASWYDLCDHTNDAGMIKRHTEGYDYGRYLVYRKVEGFDASPSPSNHLQYSTTYYDRDSSKMCTELIDIYALGDAIQTITVYRVNADGTVGEVVPTMSAPTLG